MKTATSYKLLILAAISATMIGSASAQQGNINGSLTVGYYNGASGWASLAVGYNNWAQATESACFGDSNVVSASASGSIAMGYANTPTGQGCFAAGVSNATSGTNSMALGKSNATSGQYSMALGSSNTTSGQYSKALGVGVTVSSFEAIAVGAYNVPDTNPNATAWVPTDRLFVVGNGTSASATSNAMTILKDGTVLINPKGDLSMGSYTGGPTP